MTDAPLPLAPNAGWLVGRRFDLGFIFGIAALALASGLVVLSEPALFPIVLMLDVWLLGYQHVLSTFTRLCFDKESMRRHRFLVFQLPFIVFACSVAAGWGIGIWVLGTTYFYWQWFHYIRQSWGISQVYRRKSNGAEMESERFLQVAFYLLPVTGILARSYTDPEIFLGLELRAIPVPGALLGVFAAATVASLVAWTASRVRMLLRGTLPVAHTAYMLSHFAVFAAGYLLISDITVGWLVINVWHNAQYILFVWLFNNRKFSNGLDAKARLLSFVSQTQNWPYYFMACLSISTTVYLVIKVSSEMLTMIALPAIIIYQTINFHHYIVDGVIWKARKKPMREALGLKA